MAYHGKHTLEKWVTEQLVDESRTQLGEDGKEETATCRQISVCHMQGASPREIYTLKLDGSSTAARIADLLRGKAESYCAEIPGQQTCCLQAFFGESGEAQAVKPFQVSPALSFGENGLATEAPTTSGMRQQEMRHNETAIKLGFDAMSRAFEMMARTVELTQKSHETLMKHNHELLEENLDATAVVREMTMNVMNERHTKEMELETQRRESEERKKWLSMAPMLVNTILGREVFPQGNADTALVESIAESLDEESVMKIAGVLKPEMMGPLMARFQGIIEKKTRQKQETKDAMELGAGASVDAEYHQ